MNKEKIISISILVLIIITVILIFTGLDLGAKPSEAVEGETMQITSSDYSRYIFVGTNNKEYIVNKIEEYLDMQDIEGAAADYYDLEAYENVYIVEVMETIDFYTYHNLIGWLNGMSFEDELPLYSVGIAYHKSKDDLGYICALQQINPGDTLVGQMRDGRKMTIYLPEAYEEIITFHSDDYDIAALDGYIEMMREDGVLD